MCERATRGVRAAWVQCGDKTWASESDCLAPPLTSSVTMGKFLRLSDPQAPHQPNEENSVRRVVRGEGETAWGKPGLVPCVGQALVLLRLLLWLTVSSHAGLVGCTNTLVSSGLQLGVFLAVFSHCSLLVCRNAVNHCVLILYSDTMLNLFVSSNCFVGFFNRFFRVFYI